MAMLINLKNITWVINVDCLSKVTIVSTEYKHEHTRLHLNEFNINWMKLTVFSSGSITKTDRRTWNPKNTGRTKWFIPTAREFGRFSLCRRIKDSSVCFATMNIPKTRKTEHYACCWEDYYQARILSRRKIAWRMKRNCFFPALRAQSQSFLKYAICVAPVLFIIGDTESTFCIRHVRNAEDLGYRWQLTISWQKSSKCVRIKKEKKKITKKLLSTRKTAVLRIEKPRGSWRVVPSTMKIYGRQANVLLSNFSIDLA